MSNLRNQQNGLREFKKLSKRFELPKFTTFDSSDGHRTFYLSHHSELVSTKSVSKTHRRQDKVLLQDQLNFMTQINKIPGSSMLNNEIKTNTFYGIRSRSIAPADSSTVCTGLESFNPNKTQQFGFKQTP